MKSINDVVVVAYGRSPITKAARGALASVAPTELGAQVLNGVLKRVDKLSPDMIDDVIVGCAFPEEYQGYNLGRTMAKRAGLPDAAPGQTINRFCSSGLQAIAHGANAIAAGQADIIVAGGVECSSWCPMTVFDFSALDTYLFKHKPAIYAPMGMTAEIVVENAKAMLGMEITREAMDRFALRSHQRASKAQKNGKFKKEIIPISYTDRQGESRVLMDDDGIRHDASYEALETLAAVFKEGGTVTAGNSSPMNDGAAFVVLMSASRATELGIRAIAKFRGFAAAGCNPAVMGLGPMYAVPKLLGRLSIKPSQFDVVELNEAFAAQAIPCIKKLGLDETIVNPRGGAIALGHPLGATGAILTCKALSYLEDTGGKLALVSMCIGGGMGAAGVFEMAA
ncbi:MAG: thiolase family protein [Roseiarcus sp.]